MRDDRRSKFSGGGGDDGLKIFSEVVGCIGSAGLSVLGLVALAKRNPTSRNLSTPEIMRRIPGYLIGAGLASCKIGASLGGSLHGKLTESGRRDRENMLLKAVRTGKPQTYSDGPLKGSVTPQPSYTDPQTNMRCTTTVDVLRKDNEASEAYDTTCFNRQTGKHEKVFA